MKAVLDTNVLVSGLFWRGAPYRCLLAAEAGLFELVICGEIMDELKKVLTEKFGLSREEVEASVGAIRKLGRMVKISGRLQVVKDDPDDDKFLESALAAGAQVIVSGDHHLLELKEYQGVHIIKPGEFLEQVLNEHGGGVIYP